MSKKNYLEIRIYDPSNVEEISRIACALHGLAEGWAKDENRKELQRVIVEDTPEPVKAQQVEDAKEKAAKEEVAKEKAAKEKEAKDKAAKEKAAKEKEAKDKAAKEEVAKEKEAKEKAAKEKEAKDKAAKEEATKETAEEEEGAPGEYTTEELRALLQEKIAGHRTKVKKKLTALGAGNITELSEERYTEFAEFLKELI